MTDHQTKANKTDVGNGSYGICRVIDTSRSPSPYPKRWVLKMIKFLPLVTILALAIYCYQPGDAPQFTIYTKIGSISISAEPGIAELAVWTRIKDDSLFRVMYDTYPRESLYIRSSALIRFLGPTPKFERDIDGYVFWIPYWSLIFLAILPFGLHCRQHLIG